MQGAQLCQILTKLTGSRAGYVESRAAECRCQLQPCTLDISGEANQGCNEQQLWIWGNQQHARVYQV